MELYLIEDYKLVYPDLAGQDLTDALVMRLLEEPAGGRILRTEAGKPYLAGGGPHFSVSHSGSVFACVFDERPVGLDIQKVKKADTEGIARRYFTPPEDEYVRREGPYAFFRLWARKEAFTKLFGKKLVDVISRECMMDRDDLAFEEFDLGGGLLGCVCQEAERGEKG